MRDQIRKGLVPEPRSVGSGKVTEDFRSLGNFRSRVEQLPLIHPSRRCLVHGRIRRRVGPSEKTDLDHHVNPAKRVGGAGNDHRVVGPTGPILIRL